MIRFLLVQRELLPPIVFHLLERVEQVALRMVKVARIPNDAGLLTSVKHAMMERHGATANIAPCAQENEAMKFVALSSSTPCQENLIMNERL